MIAAILFRVIRSWLPCQHYELGYELGRSLADARLGRYLVDGASAGYRTRDAVLTGAPWKPAGKLVGIRGGQGRAS